MLKRAILAACLVVCTTVGSMSDGLAAGLHGGGGFGAAPAYLVPASADLYLELNTGLGQGETLQQLWKAYLSHPGTAAAVKSMIMGPKGLDVGSIMPQLQSLLSFTGPRVGVALWVTSKKATQPGQSSTTDVSDITIVAQLTPAALLNNASAPQKLLGTFTPVTTYRGAPVFKAGSGSTYISMFSGDGVIASSLSGIQRAIDAGTFAAPNLANDTSFVQTTASLPAVRLFTAYMTPKFLAGGQSLSQAAGLLGVPKRTATFTSAQALLKPMAYAAIAAPDGLEMVSSAVTAPTGTSATPNQGASIVGNSAVLYLSINDIAAAVMGTGVLDPKTLQQLQAQTGVSFQQDIMPLLSHEVVFDVNDEVNPIVMYLTAAAGSSSNSPTVPALPGSLELASWVDSPAVAQQAMTHLIAALSRATQSSSSSGALKLQQRTLPDGSTAYTVPGIPAVGYTIRDHWLIVSSNLDGDITAAKVPLAGDAEYQAALAHVSNGSPMASVSYMNLGRLWQMVTPWLRFADLILRTQGPGSQGSQPPLGASTVPVWKQIAPLLAPLHNVIGVSRQVAPGSYQAATFITIKP